MEWKNIGTALHFGDAQVHVLKYPGVHGYKFIVFINFYH